MEIFQFGSGCSDRRNFPAGFSIQEAHGHYGFVGQPGPVGIEGTIRRIADFIQSRRIKKYSI
jgi:hypothetical protein